jgi:epoxyqueuosine reductase QueG
MCFDKIYRGSKEMQMDFLSAAIACGLGEKGLHNVLVTDEFGPFVRVCFVLTDAEIEATPIKEPHLCDRCGECVKACRFGAVSVK